MNDAAERQQAEDAADAYGKAHGDQQAPLGVVDGSGGRLAGLCRKGAIVLDPRVGCLAEARADVCQGSYQLCDGGFALPRIRHGHDLLRADDVLAAQLPEVAQHPSVHVVRDELVGVFDEQACQFRFVRVKQRPGAGLLRFVGHQQIAADIHPQFGEAAGNLPQCLETSDLGFRHEPVSNFDPVQLDSDKNAKADEDQHWHGEQEDQTSRDRHGLRALRSVERSCCATLRSNHGAEPPTRRLPRAAQLSTSAMTEDLFLHSENDNGNRRRVHERGFTRAAFGATRQWQRVLAVLAPAVTWPV